MKQKLGEVEEGTFLVASRIPTQFPKLPPYPKVLGKAIVAFFFIFYLMSSAIYSARIPFEDLEEMGRFHWAGGRK